MEEIIPTLVGAFAAGGIGVFCFILQKRMDAISDFKIFISIKDAEIDSVKNALTFYRDTKVEIRNEVFRARLFLGNKKRAALQAVWDEYSNIKEENLTGYRTYEAQRLPVGDKLKEPEEYLHKFMERFLKSV